MQKLITIREDRNETISLRRRMLQAGCFPLLILGSGIPILIVSVVALTRLPMSANSSRLQSLIATGGFLLLAVNVIASEGLRVGAAMMGSHAGAVGSSSLPDRLRVIQRRLLPAEISLMVLRLLTYLLVGFVSLFLALASTRSATARSPAEWGVAMGFLLRRVQGILSTVSPGEAGVLGFLVSVGVHSIVGPFLVAPYSAALGAIAGARVGPDGKPVGLALGLRFGASLAGSLAFLWGWALLFLAGLTIKDVGSYPFITPRLQAVVLRLGESVITPAAAASAAGIGVALYALSQIVMARIYSIVAIRQQAVRRRVPRRKERFAEILEAVVPSEGRKETST